MTLKRINGTWILCEHGQPIFKGSHADMINVLLNLWG